MSPESRKTLGFVTVALVLTGAAYLNTADRTGADVVFNDQGQPFFPDFKDPLACTDMEVVEFDDSTATVRQFKVMFKDGKWVIPSHHNYPADAKDRLAKTAAGVIDLVKDTIRSDRPEDHEALGVLDPLDLKGPLKGRGKRITLKDKSEKVLADFIIGNEVRDRTGQRYVRVPSQKRTYGVNVNVDLSTRFPDWIETNLLKLDASHLRSITFNSQKVDPERGRLIPGEVITITRKDAGAPWEFEGGLPAEQELNTEKLTTLTSALGDLKLVGVRPKPPGLSRELKLASTNTVEAKTNSELSSLLSKGFYPTDKGLYSNQGEVILKTDEGAVYTLRYGEVVFATGDQLEAGGAEEDSAKSAEKPAEGAKENRYLMVTVSFDPTLLPEPEKPQESLVIPDDPFQKAPDDPKRIAEEKAAQEKADRERAEDEKRIAEAEKKVKELSDRFADWYYVTPGESFRSIALDRSGIVQPKGTNPPTPPPSGGFPAGGLPPGLSLPEGLGGAHP
ncbi:MAG: DUF4340 domain-containing protein [Isosphaeraceae bacterium]